MESHCHYEVTRYRPVWGIVFVHIFGLQYCLWTIVAVQNVRKSIFVHLHE